MFCPNCGRDVTDATNFCYHCGCKLETAPAPAPVNETPVEETAAPAAVETPVAVFEEPAISAAEPSPAEETAPVEIPAPTGEPAVPAAPAAPAVPAAESAPTGDKKAAKQAKAAAKAAEKNAAKAAKAEAKAAKKRSFCRVCGNPVDVRTKKCTACGKKHSKAGTAAAIILLTLLLAAAAGLNVYQYMENEKAIDSKDTEIAALNNSVSDKEKEIKELNETVKSNESLIESQKATISELENSINGYLDEIDALNASSSSYAQYYNDIIYYANWYSLGYASENFRTSDSVVVLSQDDYYRDLTLTAYWNPSGTVDVEYYGTSANLTFDNTTWTTETTASIVPYHTGVTLVTFTNDVDYSTFSVLIIVTE